MVAVELHNLGHVEIHCGNAEAAERCFAECAAMAGDDPYSLALGRANEAAVAYVRGDAERAEELLAAADEMVKDRAIDLAADDEAEIEWLRAQLAARAGE
jgi:hypothetical protein